MSKQGSKEKDIRKFNRLLRLIRLSPKRGLQLFYEKYVRLIQSMAVCEFGNKINPDEIVSEVLIRVHNSANKHFEIDRSPTGWLHKVTKSAGIDLWRKYNFRPLDETNVADSRNDYQSLETNENFYHYIKNLSEKEHIIMIYRFIWGYTFQEIAELIDAPSTTVSALYYRAFEKIKEELDLNSAQILQEKQENFE